MDSELKRKQEQSLRKIKGQISVDKIREQLKGKESSLKDIIQKIKDNPEEDVNAQPADEPETYSTIEKENVEPAYLSAGLKVKKEDQKKEFVNTVDSLTRKGMSKEEAQSFAEKELGFNPFKEKSKEVDSKYSDIFDVMSKKIKEAYKNRSLDKK